MSDICGESTDWGLVESFDCDDGSLDGIDPAMAFTLGAEWQMFFDTLEATGGEFSQSVHLANAGRLQKMCWRHRREVELTDTGDGWVTLTVMPRRQTRGNPYR